MKKILEPQLSQSTIVIQSYRFQNIPAWITTCIQSVRAWADKSDFAYKCVGDEVFDMLDRCCAALLAASTRPRDTNLLCEFSGE